MKNYVLFCQSNSDDQVLAVTTRPEVLRNKAKEFLDDFRDDPDVSARLWVDIYDDETAEILVLIDITGLTDLSSVIL